jgi:DNA-binding transcriptional LysR family regulator
MDLRQIRSFVHVAELGSISHAGERLRIAQPTLTRQIQSLENELGARLFRRTGRGVGLTERGEVFLARATVILRELDLAREELSGGAEVGGHVSLGVPPTVADVLSSPLIEKFSKLYPNVQLRVASSYSGHVLDWLQRAIVDLAILYQVKKDNSFRSEPLVLEHLLLVEPGGSRRKGASVRFADIARMKLILPSRQHGLRILIDRTAAQRGLTFAPVVEADSLRVQIDLVRRGLGVTILPLVSVFADVQARLLTASPIVEPELTRRLVLATPVDRQLSAAVRRFAATIETQVTELVSSGRWRGVLLRE